MSLTPGGCESCYIHSDWTLRTVSGQVWLAATTTKFDLIARTEYSSSTYAGCPRDALKRGISFFCHCTQEAQLHQKRWAVSITAVHWTSRETRGMLGLIPFLNV
jgi:hypothetical protein